MATYETRVIREGLGFGESPRWHDGRLWYSDFYRGAIFSITPDGTDERREHDVAGQPSGLGWTPEGDLWCVSMLDQRVVRASTEETVADLSGHAGFWANEMLVAPSGVAYAGSFGFDLDQFLVDHGVEGLLASPPPTTNLVVVGPDGAVRQVVPDMSFPNGTALIDDGATLVVAETLALRLTAFDVAGDGTLSNRREWAHFDAVAPDGIWPDATGQIWVANAVAHECVLVARDGEIRERASTTQRAFACALGGPDGHELFVMTAPTSDRFVIADRRDGAIESTRVSIGA